MTIENTISSSFLNDLLKCNKARLILVIKSQDNQFYSKEDNPKWEIRIPKSKLSFSEKTTMQLMIQSTSDISFQGNEDLNDFYAEYRDQIKVRNGLILGFSDVVTFDGSLKNPFELFEKKLMPNLVSDIEVVLTDEIIVIQYKNEEIMFSDFSNNRDLTNPYLYIGLQRALITLVIAHGEKDNIEEGVDLEELNELELNPLDTKLFNLMQSKGIQQLDFQTMDQVIYLISDNMLRKFTERVGRLRDDAD